MVYDRSRVIEIALGEVGYREKASNSDLDDKHLNAGSGNWTKYGRDLDAIPDFYNGRKNGHAYCDIFCDWCFVKAYGAEGARFLTCQPRYSLGADCTLSMIYYKEHRQFDRRPEPGAQIFFGTHSVCYHTGIVVAVERGYVFTVEANVDHAVIKSTHLEGDSRIIGYGHPAYGDR